MTQQPTDPYQQFLEDARREWAESEEAIYRQYYPSETNEETR